MKSICFGKKGNDNDHNIDLPLCDHGLGEAWLVWWEVNLIVKGMLNDGRIEE